MDSIYISGGVGDFLAVETLLTQREIDGLKSVYLATRAYKHIINIIEESESYKVTNFEVIHKAWDEKIHSVWDMHHCEKVLGYKFPTNEVIADLSIQNVFLRGVRNPVRTVLSDEFTHGFKLPSRYIVVHPYTNEHPIKEANRDLTPNEFDAIVNSYNDIYLVVLGSEAGEYVPDAPNVINLMGKTTVTESIAIAQKSFGYVGINSWLSVACSKFNPFVYAVKCANSTHAKRWAKWYYYPMTNYNFFVDTFCQ